MQNIHQTCTQNSRRLEHSAWSRFPYEHRGNLHTELTGCLHTEHRRGLHTELIRGLHIEVVGGLDAELIGGLHTEHSGGLHTKPIGGLHTEHRGGLHTEDTGGFDQETCTENMHYMSTFLLFVPCANLPAPCPCLQYNLCAYHCMYASLLVSSSHCPFRRFT